MYTGTLPHPKWFLIQLHVTNECNLSCSHCSQSSGKKLEKELNTQQFLNILEDYFSILKTWNVRGHINISGGEPFMRKDLFCLLKKIHEKKPAVTYSILTNGLLVTKSLVKKLKELQPSYVQVSLEGTEKTNDSVRGKGTFKKIMRSIKILKKGGLRTFISFTAHKGNYKEFKQVVQYGKILGVDKVWTERLCPCGRASDMKKMMIEPQELKKFYYSNYELSKQLSEEKSRTSVPLVRSLCYLVDRNNEYICSAGVTVVIMPNGDVLPCTRIPITVGNLTKQTLFELWYSNDLLWKLRDKNEMSSTCKNCGYFEHCGGGARCVSYAYFGSPFKTDPQCWMAFKKLPLQDNPKEHFDEHEVELNKFLIVPKTSIQSITPYLEKEGGNMYYTDNLGKHELVRAGYDKKSSQNHLRININPSKTNLNHLITSIVNSKNKVVLFFNLTPKDLTRSAGKEILTFLMTLKEQNVDFKIANPLPRCMFGLNYNKLRQFFSAPTNCYECLELFTIKNGTIYLCKKINKKGPSLKYMRRRSQIYEYFKYFYEKLSSKKYCSKCRYHLRKNCEGCFSKQ